jgi:hypothetical protein
MQTTWSSLEEYSPVSCPLYCFGCTFYPSSVNEFVCTPWFNLDSFGNDHLRAVWRVSLGLGAVPAIVVFLWRLNMDEPTRYKKDSMKRVRIPYKLVLRRYWVSLTAISAIWYVLITVPIWHWKSATADFRATRFLYDFIVWVVREFDLTPVFIWLC